MYKYVGYLIRKNEFEFFPELIKDKQRAKQMCESNGIPQSMITQIFYFEKQPINEVESEIKEDE